MPLLIAIAAVAIPLAIYGIIIETVKYVALVGLAYLFAWLCIAGTLWCLGYAAVSLLVGA